MSRIKKGLSSRQDAAELGMELCRLGEWEDGYSLLAKVVAGGESRKDLPGYFYSCLGYGVARFEGRHREGIKLAERALKMEFYDPANYLNMARTYLLAGDLPKAAEVLEKGVEIDPENSALLELQYRMGLRRRPVLPFLSRRNLLNRWLGRVRSRVASDS